MADTLVRPLFVGPVDLIGDTPQNVQRVAGIVATALAAYLERHYGWK